MFRVYKRVAGGLWQDRRGATVLEFALVTGIVVAFLAIAANKLTLSVGDSMTDTAGVLGGSHCVGSATATASRGAGPTGGPPPGSRSCP